MSVISAYPLKESEANAAFTITIFAEADYLGKFSSGPESYGLIESVPESFLRALDDFEHGRVEDDDL